MSFFSTHIVGKEQLPGATSTPSAAVVRTKAITLTGIKGSITLTSNKGALNIDES